jgi:hypothetical protein
MGLLVLSDQRLDLRPVIGEIAQSVEHLGLGQVQGLGDVWDGFVPQMQRGHVMDRDPQPVDDGFAAANAVAADDVRVVGLHKAWHKEIPEIAALELGSR